jgi:hypothetical protein
MLAGDSPESQDLRPAPLATPNSTWPSGFPAWRQRWPADVGRSIVSVADLCVGDYDGAVNEPQPRAGILAQRRRKCRLTGVSS